MSEAGTSNDLPRRMESSPAENRIRSTPRTHDTSFTECHIRDIKKLGADLNEAVQAAWPKRHSIRYSNVRVLFLSWQDDDLGVEAEIEPLRRVFEDRYHFVAQDYKIPSIKPDKALKKRVFDFLEEEDKDTLLIVYYAGHARGALQSNEASLWFANRNDPHLVLPSGGIQSMFEEADADVILLCDCCHSTAIPTTDSHQRSNKVMEAITACGYEAVAAEVGDHSFTKALTHTLAIASKGLPFTISELHARVVSKLKCCAPELLKGSDGNYVDAAENRLLYEQQPRRTPIFTVVCRATPTRSILLAPLGTLYPSPAESGEDTYYHSYGKSKANVDISESEGPSKGDTCEHLPKKRRRSLGDEGRYPYILLSARLERQYDKQAWLEWVRNAPVDVKDIHIEGAFASFSTLLLLRVPVAVWNLLQSNSAYTFLGYITSGNYAVSERCNCTGATICEVCRQISQSRIQDGNAVAHAHSTESLSSGTLEQQSTISQSSKPGRLNQDEKTNTSRSIVPQIDSAHDESSTATSVGTSSLQRKRLLNGGLASFPKLDILHSSSVAPSIPLPSADPLSTSSAKSMTESSQTVSSLAGLSLDGGTSSKPINTRDNHHRPSSHGHRRGRGRGRSTSNQSASTEHWEWFWYCCGCGHGLISMFMESCPNQCGHLRCQSCPMESHKVRNVA